MRVIGVDPGISHTGYGIVEVGNRGALIHVASGGIVTSSQMLFVERLLKIHKGLDEIIHLYTPECLAIEEVFLAKNVHAALVLGHARGVILLCAGIAGIPVFEYSATTMKVALCRFGRATKEQVTAMVKVLLHLERKLPTHTADALAACICHIHTHGNTTRSNYTMSRHSDPLSSHPASYVSSRRIDRL
jgi:crossover junction endodeoxyribonuclease RuvC